jgi:hypothetical protein
MIQIKPHECERMLEIPAATNENLPADVAAVRQVFMNGLTTVETLAAAIGRCPQSVRNYVKQGMPAVYIGNTCYPIVEESRRWLISRRAPTAE